MSGARRIFRTVAAALGLLLGLLCLLPARADAPPVAQFSESFTTFAYADGARSTAFWDRDGGRLTLRPPDAGFLRRWPALAPAAAGDLIVAWVEDRGEGPHIWAQRLDRHGNRLWAADASLIPWQGAWPPAAAAAHPLALAAGPEGATRLAWSDAAGVWSGVWAPETGWQQGPTRLAESSSARMSLRCLQAACALLWQTPGQTEVRLFSPDPGPALTLPGPAHAAWRAADDLWLAWQQPEGVAIQRFDRQLHPHWPAPRILAGELQAAADIADLGGDLFILSPAPLTVLAVRGEDGAAETRLISQRQAQTAHWAATPRQLALIWQTPAPASLWMRWLDGVSPWSEALLLRLDAPGLEPILGDAGPAVAETAAAVAWTEGRQVFVRPWLPGGWSPWRHEVAPAYAATSGWVAAEGLAHSLTVNPPWQNVAAVTLQADVNLLGGAVQFFVSNQGPRAWQAIAPGQRVLFPQPGHDLRWYARLRRSPWGMGPEVQEVRLLYEYLWMQHLPRLAQP